MIKAYKEELGVDGPPAQEKTKRRQVNVNVKH